MSVFRYVAVPGTGGPPRRGELAAGSAAEVRASLRRVGLQVVDVKPVRSRARAWPRSGGGRRRWHVAEALRDWCDRLLRNRRVDERAELYDGLATMLDSGLPLIEAVDALVQSTGRRRSSERTMLVEMREALRGGRSPAEAMAAHPAWFDASEVAMVRAGHHSGTLPEVLAALHRRHERAGELGHKLAQALAYPALVAMVGVGVVVFLSVNTLPNLVSVLTDAGIEPPALTMRVMFVGQVVAAWGFLLAAIALVVAVASVALARWAMRVGVEPPAWLRGLSPAVLRRMALAQLSFQLAQMLRSGVPLVEALRVLAPTAAPGLGRRLTSAADRVEQGDELAVALDDGHWFDAEFRRLLDVGQSSGELDSLLERLGHRYARRAQRLIDRLASLLEPAVILALACAVGVVVMAAILPLLRLQEIL